MLYNTLRGPYTGIESKRERGLAYSRAAVVVLNSSQRDRQSVSLIRLSGDCVCTEDNNIANEKSLLVSLT